MKKQTCAVVAVGAWALGLGTLPGCGTDSTGKPAPPITGPREELADAESLDLLLDAMRAPVFGAGKYFQTGSWDRETGVAPPAAFVDRGNRDMNHFACRGAESSVAEAQVVPPIYDIEVCPESYVKGVALARVEGSGRMARLWMTASSLRHGAVANDEIFRIWVDDDPNPVVEEPLAALIDGSAGEMFAPPFGDGPGDHVAWYYPVVFGKKIVVGLDNLGPLEYYYHQESIVLDRAPMARKAAAHRLDTRTQAQAELSSRQDSNAGGMALGSPLAISLIPGQTTTLKDIPGPATIGALTITVAKDVVPLLPQVECQITWEDAAAPSITIAMSDLFVTSLATLDAGNASLGLAGYDDQGMLSLAFRLPMPFAKAAKFVARNDNALPVNFVLALRGTPTVPNDAFGHLFIERRETVAPAPGKKHELAHLTGRGKWAGTCMMLEGRGIGDGSLFDEPMNFLEGDEFGTLDGELTIRGTGTEDYFNGAFYFEAGSHSSPFAQWWGTQVNGLTGQTNACRFHVLGDAIDFEKSAVLELEIGPGVPATLDRYRTLAYFYR